MSAIVVMSVGLPARAQTDSEQWSPPENLSRSGAAHLPVVLTHRDGQLRVVWWDTFEGLTFVEGSPGAWSDPVTIPPPEDVTQPTISTMPQIVSDSSGTAHAFWIGEPEREGVATALLYSQLPARGSEWTQPRVMVRSAAAFAITRDSDDTLYLAYCRNLHTEASPSAIVFRLSTNGGETWTPQVMVDRSLYYRSASQGRLALRLAADADGLVVLTWNDLRRQEALIATSVDGGEVWSDVTRIGTATTPASNPRTFIPRSGQMSDALLMWQGTDSLGGCAQYHAFVADLVDGDGSTSPRILDRIGDCLNFQVELLSSLDPGHMMILTGTGTDALALRMWSEGDWSEPKHLTFRLVDPGTERSIHLSALHGVLVPLEREQADEEDDTESSALVVVGVDSDGDVWFTQSQISAQSLVFTPAAPWMAPVALASSPALPDLPTLAASAQGTLHMLWAEPETEAASTRVLRHARWTGTSWTRRTTAQQSPLGSAAEPSIVVVHDRIHAVWSDGPNEQVLYSRAFLRDAHVAGGWDEPQVLPGPTGRQGIGSRPQIVTSGMEGRLHVIYAVPVNEERGIYYTSSDDSGVTWSEATQVFDAERAGWVAVDSPKLAVDVWGMIHVVWARASLSADMPSLGVYYASSSDGGRSWSDSLLAAEGVWILPNVVTDGFGGVHVFWSGASGARSWWHLWSAASSASPNLGRDVRGGWSRETMIPGFSDIDGPVAILSDGALGLQVIGLGTDDTGEPALLQQSWSTSLEAATDDSDTWVQANGRWGSVQIYPLDPAPLDGGVSAILQPDLERLDVLYRAERLATDSTPYPSLWHSSRTITVTTLGTDALAIAQSRLTAATTVGSDDTEAVTQEPDIGPVLEVDPLNLPPAGSQAGSELSLLISSGVATLVIVGVLGIRSLGKRRG
jgi:hypothetical protein